ncbi:MAG: hypothetical protein JSV80_01315 [Acidobacteriota bacterium]|nr:MAG: hypothetical protein JSV80_01315 [Acidobacteriota bacterium]
MRVRVTEELRQLQVARLRRAARRTGGEDLLELGAKHPLFLWLYGSTLIQASVEPDGSVALNAFLVFGPKSRDVTASELAWLSIELPVGQLVRDDEGDLLLVHREAIDSPPEELESMVDQFCQHADELDDLLSERVGALRVADRIQIDVEQALRRALNRTRELVH